MKVIALLCTSFITESYSFLTQPSEFRAAIYPLHQSSQLHEIPSWDEIESKLNPSLTYPKPSVIDSSLNPNDPPQFSTERPTLFRERHGWCPYSERVYLALEVMGIPYDTVYIDNTGHGRRPSFFSGQTPQIRWEDGSTQGESMDLVRQIDRKYKQASDIDLYPTDIQNEVINKSRAFESIFPRRTRPSSRAAFLFRYDGEPLWKNEFEKVLRETNELLGQTSADGPFFCGKRFTAADIAWAPFLERYAAQLPCLHDDLNPRYDDENFPHLVAWYDAMDYFVPVYSCQVKGDASSWRKVLTMAGFGNAGVPLDVSKRMSDAKYEEARALSIDEKERIQSLWEKYCMSRPWMATSPAAEAASVMTRNRSAIMKDIEKRAVISHPLLAECTQDGVDVAMRAMVCLLCQDDLDFRDCELNTRCMSYKEDIVLVATYLDDRMCVPRDMGCLSAAALKRLIPTVQ